MKKNGASKPYNSIINWMTWLYFYSASTELQHLLTKKKNCNTCFTESYDLYINKHTKKYWNNSHYKLTLIKYGDTYRLIVIRYIHFFLRLYKQAYKEVWKQLSLLKITLIKHGETYNHKIHSFLPPWLHHIQPRQAQVPHN